MPFYTSAAIAAIAGLAVANPVNIEKRSTFTVDQVVAPNQVAVKHPAISLQKAYGKYNAQVPAAVAAAAAAAQSGSVTATSVQGDEVWFLFGD